MPSPTCLLLIDLQQAFYTDPACFGPAMSTAPISSSVSRLLSHFRTNDLPVLHVQHHSKNPDSPLHPLKATVAFLDFAEPLTSERVFTKNVNSGFIGTKLEVTLRELGIRRLVVAGLTTDHCVSTTVRMCANLDAVGTESGDGEILLVKDACAAFSKSGIDAEIVHMVNLASLNEEFCKVVGIDETLVLLRNQL